MVPHIWLPPQHQLCRFYDHVLTSFFTYKLCFKCLQLKQRATDLIATSTYIQQHCEQRVHTREESLVNPSIWSEAQLKANLPLYRYHNPGCHQIHSWPSNRCHLLKSNGFSHAIVVVWGTIPEPGPSTIKDGLRWSSSPAGPSTCRIWAPEKTSALLADAWSNISTIYLQQRFSLK